MSNIKQGREETIKYLESQLSFNFDDLNLNTPAGREELCIRFLLSKRYPLNAVCILMGQLKHESDRFRTMREYGNAKYFSKYDGRKDLGNIKPGDGAKYSGKGFLQLTGRGNFSKVGSVLGINLVDYPELAEHPVVALYIVDWFIHHGNKFKNGQNVLDCAIAGDIEKVTRLINGGRNGIAERIKYAKEYESRIGVLHPQR